MDKTTIQIEGLARRYGKKDALRDITLTIGPGMTGLLGRNGAGKTTLMKILATLLRPTAGSVTLCGIPLQNTRAIRRAIGYLPQDFSMYPSMTVSAVLDYLGVLSEMPAPLRAQRAESLLHSLNLYGERDKKVRALSGGMKRRLGVAQALLHEPRVLIADEPTVGLDPEERVRLRQLLMAVAKDRIVLLSTHIVEDIEASCENVAILDGGRLKYSGAIRQLVAQTGADSMETAYLRTIQSKEVV